MPAQDHERLASHPVRQQAGEQRREHAAQQHRRHDDRELAGVQFGRGFEVRQRAADDADIDAVEQAAQPCNQKQQAVIGVRMTQIGGTWHRGDHAG